MRYLVLGSGVSGRAAARLLRRLGEQVSLFDDSSETLAAMQDEAFETHGGEWDRRHLRGLDVVVSSPGFAESSAPIVDVMAAELPLWSEVELGARNTTAPIVAVTGTNGKTTTTQLIADMATASGIDAVAAGNIGVALCDVVDSDHDVIVVEASSFQLRFIDSFAPAVAVVVNVAPDHLDWHGTFEAYAAAKARITDNMAESDPLVFDEDDDGAAAIASASGVRTLGVSGSRVGAAGGFLDGELVVGSEQMAIGSVDAILAVDIAIAAVAATEVGATPDGICSAIAAFVPAPHRRTVILEEDGVTWIDDSKATNPHAAVASAASFSSVILIAGGRAKGLDLTPLGTVPTVRHIVAIGEAAPQLLDIASGRATAAASMDEAVAVAAQLAEPGDTVLLAPGCASFDQFSSYAERGDRFAEAVRTRSN